MAKSRNGELGLFSNGRSAALYPEGGSPCGIAHLAAKIVLNAEFHTYHLLLYAETLLRCLSAAENSPENSKQDP
jgi:hypothetical protein